MAPGFSLIKSWLAVVLVVIVLVPTLLRVPPVAAQDSCAYTIENTGDRAVQFFAFVGDSVIRLATIDGGGTETVVLPLAYDPAVNSFSLFFEDDGAPTSVQNQFLPCGEAFTFDGSALPGTDWRRLELRPNRSLFLEWNHTGLEASYAISIVEPGSSPEPTLTVPALSQNGSTMRRVLTAGEEWPGVPGQTYELSILAAGAVDWSPPARVTVGTDAPIEVQQTSASGSSVSVSWTQADSSQPFLRYDLFLAEENERLLSCSAGAVSDRTTTSTTLTTKGCGGDALSAGNDYTVGVRVVYSDEPFVASEIEAATAATSGGDPAAERFATAEVAGTWEIVNPGGTPVVWNGVNLRRGDDNDFFDNSFEFFDMEQIGFDTIRVVMNWDRFQTGHGTFDVRSFAELDEVVAAAEAAGLDIILDPIHIAGGGRWHVPWWAWQQTNDGNDSSFKMLQAIDENAHEYMTHVVQRYRDRPNVVAIDLLNEPREPVSSQRPSNNVILMDLYHDLIETIRDVDQDKPLILGAFYGSAKISADTLGGVRDATVANPQPVAAEYDNLIWSFHDYYLGNEGNPWSDGLYSDGYPNRGRDDFNTLVRSESWDGTGCYPSGDSASNCTWLNNRENLLVPSMRQHAIEFYDPGQEADMPTFVGEFGMPHPSSRRAAWTGGEMFFSDKVAVYDELGLSRTAWAWSTQADETYGLYDRSTRTAHPWSAYAVGSASIGLPGSGDVDCDGAQTIVDALFIAQFTVGIRGEASCPLGDAAADADVSEGDVDGSGTADIVDALLIARCVSGIRGPACSGS